MPQHHRAHAPQAPRRSRHAGQPLRILAGHDGQPPGFTATEITTRFTSPADPARARRIQRGDLHAQRTPCQRAPGSAAYVAGQHVPALSWVAVATFPRRRLVKHCTSRFRGAVASYLVITVCPVGGRSGPGPIFGIQRERDIPFLACIWPEPADGVAVLGRPSLDRTEPGCAWLKRLSPNRK